MKIPQCAIAVLTAFLASSASAASILTSGNGNLPQCALQCTVLTQSQQACGGGSSTTAAVWSCFCKAAWTGSGQSPATMCQTSCTNPSDITEVTTWYTANCGSDNGASEHGGSSGGGTNAVSGTSGAGAGGSSSSSGTPTGVEASDGNGGGCGTTWWSCHWQWIVMVIVVAVGLIILGFGGRWLKKRHDRKKDQISEGFNTGITSRGVTSDKAPGNNGSSYPGPIVDNGSERNTPSRTREAFMPYGYGYSRSESRQANIDRGGTPVNEIEKGEGRVRERSTGRDSGR